MKPYSYNGTKHSNMGEVQKWRESAPSGERRLNTRRAQATVAMHKRITTRRGRNLNKKLCKEIE